MNLKLTRPLVFFDLETTGIHIAKDRIVAIALLKIYPNNTKESKSWLVNPLIPIPKESTAIHGITNEGVKNEPTFQQIAPKVYSYFKGADVAGFNSNRFDVPLLVEEFLRNNIEDFTKEKRAFIDVQAIFHKKEQRTLSAGYEFYCGKKLKDAHNALADTQATYEILLAQTQRYDDLKGDVKTLHNFSIHKKFADLAGFIAYNSLGQEIFTFGKYKGKVISEIFKENPAYYAWIQKAVFPLYTKKIFTQIHLKNNIKTKK